MEKDRAAIYKFLSIGFAYPEEGFDDILARSIALLSPHYTNLNEYGYRISGIKNIKKGLGELSSRGLNEWKAIYTSLFISNFPTTPLHPYESFYKEGLLVSDSSEQVARLYGDCGITIFDSKEFPDIINLELEFASFIIENRKGCLPVYKDFFENHLFTWIFDFFKDIEEYSETPLFYTSLAHMGTSFLKKEQKVIREFVDER